MDSYLKNLLASTGLPAGSDVAFTHDDPVIPSRFRIGRAAATALAAVGVASNEIWKLSGRRDQEIAVDVKGAAISLISFLCQRLETGDQPVRDPNRPLVGFYQAGDGRWIHLHGAFPRLAQGTMRVLGCKEDAVSVARSVAGWQAQELEDALAEAGMCGAMARTRDEWLRHEQGKVLSGIPAVVIKKIGDSDPEPFGSRSRPLENVRVLDLTRVLAGPTCARTLAAHGANVLKINSPNLPSVPPFVMDTGHGKRSAFLELTSKSDAGILRGLAATSDIFSQGYRKGALGGHGFGPEELAALRPGIVYVSINAYGHEGPWANRPGWEQLAQTATGVAVDEGSEAQPKLIGAAATDYTTGYLAALGAMAALYRRGKEGGSYHVEVSLSQTANWLYTFGLFEKGGVQPALDLADAAPFMISSETGFGKLHHLGPILQMSETPHIGFSPRFRLGPTKRNGDARIFNRRQLNIVAAIFSAIIMTGAFKLPLVISGMIEASTTRKFSIP